MAYAPRASPRAPCRKRYPPNVVDGQATSSSFGEVSEKTARSGPSRSDEIFRAPSAPRTCSSQGPSYGSSRHCSSCTASPDLSRPASSTTTLKNSLSCPGPCSRSSHASRSRLKPWPRLSSLIQTAPVQTATTSSPSTCSRGRARSGWAYSGSGGSAGSAGSSPSPGRRWSRGRGPRRARFRDGRSFPRVEHGRQLPRLDQATTKPPPTASTSRRADEPSPDGTNGSPTGARPHLNAGRSPPRLPRPIARRRARDRRSPPRARRRRRCPRKRPVPERRVLLHRYRPPLRGRPPSSSCQATSQPSPAAVIWSRTRRPFEDLGSGPDLACGGLKPWALPRCRPQPRRRPRSPPARVAVAASVAVAGLGRLAAICCQHQRARGQHEHREARTQTRSIQSRHLPSSLSHVGFVASSSRTGRRDGMTLSACGLRHNPRCSISTRRYRRRWAMPCMPRRYCRTPVGSS